MQSILFDIPEQPTTHTLARVPIVRVQLVREGSLPAYRTAIRSPAQAADLLRALIADNDREVFAILMLSTKNRPLGLHVVSTGILDSSLVHPREVFKAALLSNAASILCAHNHPSGDPTPSQEDKRITQRLVQAGQILGVEVLDHLILGDEGRYISLKEQGVL